MIDITHILKAQNTIKIANTVMEVVGVQSEIARKKATIMISIETTNIVEVIIRVLTIVVDILNVMNHLSRSEDPDLDLKIGMIEMKDMIQRGTRKSKVLNKVLIVKKEEDLRAKKSAQIEKKQKGLTKEKKMIGTVGEILMMIIKTLKIEGIEKILKKNCVKIVIDNRTLRAHKIRGIDKTKSRNLMNQNSSSKETIETDAHLTNRIRLKTTDKHLEITKNLDLKTVKMIPRMSKKKEV